MPVDTMQDHEKLLILFYTKDEDVMPPAETVMRLFGWNSSQLGAAMEKLMDEGFISRDPLDATRIEVERCQ